jgi:predicted HTH domain antitoxin
MKVKSIRIPQDIEHAVDFLSRIEKIDSTQSFRKLARIGFETYIANLYQNGKLSIREVSTELGVSISEAIDMLSEKGVKGNMKATDVLQSIHSLF